VQVNNNFTNLNVMPTCELYNSLDATERCSSVGTIFGQVIIQIGHNSATGP